MIGSQLAHTVWSGGGGLAGGALRLALLPASALFRVASRAHHGLYDSGLRARERAPIPVISVGNLRIGGAGKTPLTGWVVDRLLEMERRPVVLHGGYGSDEPALHARWHPEVPVLVGRDRAVNAHAAALAGRDVAVLDDGFQHRRLHRQLDIVLLAAEHGVNAIRLLPRGPWREPLRALRRADVVVVTRKTASAATAEEVAVRVERQTGRRAVRAWIGPDGWSTLSGESAVAPDGEGVEAVAVAGIAEPESFFRTTESLGIRIGTRLAFPDHHEYTVRDVERILRVAGGRPVVTTAKDAVKLDVLHYVADVRVLEQRVRIEDGEEGLVEMIRSAIE